MRFEEHLPAIRAMAAAIVGRTDAEDVVQETVLAALQNPVDGNVRAWLLRIALNKARDLLRRRKVRGVTSSRLDARPAPSTPDVESVRRFFRGLPPRYRAMLHLAYFEEMPYREIAAFFGVSVAAVKMTILRAHRALRAAGEKHEV